MADLDVHECETYADFAREWHADTLADHGVSLEQAREQGLITEDDTRLYWQLLSQLDAEELLVVLPEWLADEKVGYVDGATPTAFVGRLDRETEKAIKLGEAAGAGSLLKLAHRIHELEADAANSDREEWLADRLQDHRERFEARDDAPTLAEPWVPKSQLELAVRRVSSE